MRHAPHHPPRRPSGLSLVELMVSLAIGMVLVAIGLLATVQQLRGTGRLQREQRLAQDLHSTVDLITRDLRRATHWQAAEAGVWPAAASGPHHNPHRVSFPDAGADPAPDVDVGTEAGTTSTQVDFSYSVDAEHRSPGDPAAPDLVASNERFGYRLRDGVIQAHLGGAGWQALTDPGRLTVSSLQLTPRVQEVPFAGLCDRPCPPRGEPGACPPRQQLTHVELRVVAHASGQPSLQSRMNAHVRLRNDTLSGACPP